MRESRRKKKGQRTYLPFKAFHSLDKDDLVVFVDTILVDPVRVEAAHQHTSQNCTCCINSHSEVTTSSGDSLLGSALQSSLVLQVVDTLSNGFTVSSTLWRRLLSVSSSNSNSVDEVTLLGLVTQSSSLVRSRRSGSSVDNGELSVLPASDSRDELENVRLLLGVELTQVLVGSHRDLIF